MFPECPLAEPSIKNRGVRKRDRKRLCELKTCSSSIVTLDKARMATMFIALPWYLIKGLCKTLWIKLLRGNGSVPLIRLSVNASIDDRVTAVAEYIKSRKCGSICLMVRTGLAFLAF